MLSFPLAANAQDDDQLVYSVGGTMSSPYSLNVNLKNGIFTVKEEIGFHPENPHIKTVNGQINRHRLQMLKNMTRLAMKKGLESQFCKDKRLKAERAGTVPIPDPGSIDYIPQLHIGLGLSSASIIGSACWSETAEELSKFAYEATRITHK